jgi:hypothetical protein
MSEDEITGGGSQTHSLTDPVRTPRACTKPTRCSLCAHKCAGWNGDEMDGVHSKLKSCTHNSRISVQCPEHTAKPVAMGHGPSKVAVNHAIARTYSYKHPQETRPVALSELELQLVYATRTQPRLAAVGSKLPPPTASGATGAAANRWLRSVPRTPLTTATCSTTLGLPGRRQ